MGLQKKSQSWRPSAGQESENAVNAVLSFLSFEKGINSINHVCGDCQSVL